MNVIHERGQGDEYASGVANDASKRRRLGSQQQAENELSENLEDRESLGYLLGIAGSLVLVFWALGGDWFTGGADPTLVPPRAGVVSKFFTQLRYGPLGGFIDHTLDTLLNHWLGTLVAVGLLMPSWKLLGSVREKEREYARRYKEQLKRR